MNEVLAAPAPLESAAERRKTGRALRAQIPRAGHAEWKPSADRADPVDILEAQSRTRVQSLIPIRYGRMLVSPFAFYRGSAAIMAADLAQTPTTGLRAQCCGDAHLVNFGAYATPERNLVFDVNDFDETLPAAWEWDLKRLCASVVVAARFNGFTRKEAAAAAAAAAGSYREKMNRYAGAAPLDVWYAGIDARDVIMEAQAHARRLRRAPAPPSHISARVYPTIERKGGTLRFADDPPLIYHLPPGQLSEVNVDDTLRRYRNSLRPDIRVLLDRYRCVDTAVKVVGVGSVGTWCAIALFVTADEQVLVLQVKQAVASVLERFAGPSECAHSGQRVVEGQRLMQAASDTLLGYTHDDGGVDYYVRQLRDVKVTPVITDMTPPILAHYAACCGWALARAHARSGDPAAIAGYIGNGDALDRALADFAQAYADQNQRDYDTFAQAVKSGRITAAKI